jgi:hypothetical protein
MARIREVQKGHLLGILIILIGLSMIWITQLVLAETQYKWDTDPDPVDVEILIPQYDNTICAPGSSNAATAQVSDYDKYCERYRSTPDDDWGPWYGWYEPISDSCKIWWTDTSGKFTNDDYTDSYVLYITTDTDATSNTLTCYADDDWINPKDPDYPGSINDPNVYYNGQLQENTIGTANDDPDNESRTLTIAQVTSVVWETYPDDVTEYPDHGANLGLDGCPKNGDKRIYPGKKDCDDSAAETLMRRKVKVKATLNCTPYLSDYIYVYFRAWDVDDPSANTSPVDDDNKVDPNDISIDNRGSFGFDTGGTKTKVVRASGSSSVIATFYVSYQPGDNYRITATTCSSRNNELNSYKVENNNLPPTVKRSEMLTTWRKLHAELDSMETIPTSGAEKNFVSGDITNVTGTGPYTATTDQSLLDADMYENGTLAKGGSYTVEGAPNCNSSGANSWVLVDPNCGTGSFTSLTDDDTQTMPSLPDTGLMNSIFDDCYIYCENDAPGGQSDVSFDLNIGGTSTSNNDIRNSSSRDSGSYESSNYWAVYVLGAYQAGYDQDFDPDSELGPFGHTTSDDNQYTAIYFEGMKDWGATSSTARQVVVHEVGHQFGLGHTSNTIMNATVPISSSYEIFSDADINTIRGISSP